MHRGGRSRSRSQERGKLVKFLLNKQGPPLSELDIKGQLCQFGEVQSLVVVSNSPGLQKVILDVKLKNSPIEEVLNFVNTHLRSNGWNIVEIGKESSSMVGGMMQNPQMMHQMHSGMYSFGMGGGQMMSGVPIFYQHNPLNANPLHAMPPQPPPGRPHSMMHMQNQGSFMPQQMIPMNPMRVSQPQNSRPHPTPISSMTGISPQASRTAEEKIEITSDMMKNLKALKNPDRMMQLLKLEPDVVQKLALGLANENHLSLVVHNIKVREIWVGNLVEETTEQDVRNAFSVYGRIESVEMFNKPNQIFAFLKYYKVKQAAKAFENIDNLSLAMRLNLRISYSDFTKRNNIVGDNPTLEDNYEDLSPYLFMAYNSGINLPRIKHLQRRLSEFGKIKGILMKPSYNSNFKSFVVSEFENSEQAIKARKYYLLNDKASKRRFKLGNRDIDINVLTKVPEFRKFEITSQMIKVSPNLMGSSMKNALLSKLKGKTVNEEIQEIFASLPEKQVASPIIENELKSVPSTQKILQEYVENKQLIKRYNLVWSGIVYRGIKKKHFFADALHVSGDSDLTSSIPERLILSHKTSLKDVIQRKRIGVLAFTPANRVAYPEFMEVLQGFDLVGVSFQIKKYIIFVVPFNEKLKELVPELDSVSFVGIFVEKGDMDSEENFAKIAEDSEEIIVEGGLDDKKDKIVKRHDNQSRQEEIDSDSEENYSDSNDNQESPEESDADQDYRR